MSLLIRNWIGGLGGGAGYKIINAELTTYIAGLTTKLSNTELEILDTLVTNIKTVLTSSNLSDDFDCIWLWGGETQEASLKNLAKDAHHGTGASLPSWTKYEGFQGASGKLITLNYNPATQGVRFTRDNASMFYYAMLNVQDAHTCGAESGTQKSVLQGRNSSNQFWAAINTGGYGNVGVNMDGRGMYFGCRDNATTINGYREGVKKTTVTESSTAIYNIGHYGLARRAGANTYYSSQQLAIMGYGRSFSETEVQGLTTAFKNYINAH